jgi:hypothetical protein
MGDVVEVKITRKDEFGETSKTFKDCPQYQGLKPGDVVEVEDANGELKDYYVTDTKWEFSHFGDTLVVTIQPMNPSARLVQVYAGLGQYVWIKC